MGLLSNLADNLLPRQRRGRGGGGRPLIDMPEFYSSDVGYVGAGMNAIAAIPQGALNTVTGNITTALYTTGGFQVNLGGAYKANILSIQGTADALNDPNKAAKSAAVYVGQVLGGRKGNFWTSSYKWNRLMGSFEDRFTRSIIKSSSTLSSDEKSGLLEVMNSDVGWLPDSVKKEGRQVMVDDLADKLRKKGVSTTSADRFGQLLDDVSARRKIYRKAGVAEGRSGLFNRGKRIADALAEQFTSDAQMQALLRGQDGVMFGSAVADVLGATDEELKGKVYEARLKKIAARGGDAADIAKKLSKKDDKRFGALSFINSLRDLRFGIYSTNFKNGLLNGNVFLWGSGLKDKGTYTDTRNVFSRWMGGMMSSPKMGDMNLSGFGGLLFLAHPGSWLRALWDGDWFKVLEAQLKAGKLMDPNKEFSRFLKKGIKGNINDYRDVLLQKVGLKDLIISLQKINPELAAQVQKIFKSGLDEYARSWAKGAVKLAFKKAGESVAKFLTKVGLKELGKWLGTVLLPGIGSILGWIVGELVWAVVDSFLWKIFEIIVQMLFLVIAIIIIIIMFVSGIFMESQNMFPVMLLPGQDLTTHNPRGGEEDVGGGEYLGPGVPFDYTKIESGGILNNQVCTQGYFGNSSDPVCTWSHCNLVAKEGKYAIDVSGSTDNTVYSPVNGTVLRIIKNYESLDRIEIQGDGITFYMIHIDADTCRVAKGDTVSKGEALCKLYGNDGNVDVKCPNSDSICWTGPHIHIYATNEAGLGVSNLHEIIKIDANLCDTSDN